MPRYQENKYYHYVTENPDRVRRVAVSGKRNPETGHYVYPERVVKTRLARFKGKTITVYKKCRWDDKNYTRHSALVVLKIGRLTQRMQPRNYKCRAAEAKVVAIYKVDQDEYGRNKLTKTKLALARSSYDDSFIYRVGKVARPKGEQYNHAEIHECSAGIHFFLTKQEALEYHS